MFVLLLYLYFRATISLTKHENWNTELEIHQTRLWWSLCNMNTQCKLFQKTEVSGDDVFFPPFPYMHMH